jgi:hypothetical protein
MFEYANKRRNQDHEHERLGLDERVYEQPCGWEGQVFIVDLKVGAVRGLY